MQVIQRVGLLATDSNDRPLEEVKIIKAFIKKTLSIVHASPPTQYT